MPKKAKYNNKRIGRFRSKLEQRVWMSRPRVKGSRLKYEVDTLHYIVKRRYLPDFTITLPSGKKRFVEIKGYFRSQDKTKMKLVREYNPGIDIRLVVSNDAAGEWCEKNGFPWALYHIPEDWLRD